MHKFGPMKDDSRDHSAPPRKGKPGSAGDMPPQDAGRGC
jgi:hypothetical protein